MTRHVPRRAGARVAPSGFARGSDRVPRHQYPRSCRSRRSRDACLPRDGRRGRGCPRPAALPAVPCSDGPSGHPLAFGRRCRRLPCSGAFLPGPGGLHQFQCNPSLRAAVITPPESAAAVSQRSSAADAAFAPSRELGFRTLSHGACTTFDACGPQRRSRPLRRFVRRCHPRLSPAERPSASRLPGRYRVETFTRWVALPFPFWSRQPLDRRTTS